jgi:CRP/FNR family transcriptional regulator, nitrogen oxide reductase regulator
VERPPLPPSPVFANMSDAERRDVAAAGHQRPVAGGAVLCREGDAAEALYLTLAGRLKLTQLSADGREVVLRFVAPGDVFGGLAVLDGKAYPFTAAAVGPARVLAWPRGGLGGLFDRLPAFQKNVLTIVGGHGRETLDRVRELATEAVPRRIARALTRELAHGTGQADGILVTGLTQQDLAQMAGTTLFTVSRTLAEWQRAGILETGRGRLVVRDPAALTRLSDL